MIFHWKFNDEIARIEKTRQILFTFSCDVRGTLVRVCTVNVSGSARLDHLLWLSQDKILRTVVNRNGGPPTATIVPSLASSLSLLEHISIAPAIVNAIRDT